MAAGSAGVLAGHDTDVRHELRGGGEPAQVANLGDDRHRGEEGDPAEGLEGSDQGEMTLGHGGEQSLLQAADSLTGGADHAPVVVEDDLSAGLVKADLGEPCVVPGGPGTHPMRGPDAPAEQELGEAVLGTQRVGLGVGSSTNEIAQRLVLLVGNPDRGEVAAAQ